MKKFMIVPVLALVFGFSGSVSATTDCTTLGNCSGNGNPEMVQNAWGTTNSQLPRIKRGETFTLSNGVKDTCPAWFFVDCVDVSVTQWWKDRWGK